MRDASGRFLPGPDASRHTFTTEERRRGCHNAVREPRAGGRCGDNVHVLAWVWRKVRGYYRARRRAAG